MEPGCLTLGRPDHDGSSRPTSTCSSRRVTSAGGLRTPSAAWTWHWLPGLVPHTASLTVQEHVDAGAPRAAVNAATAVEAVVPEAAAEAVSATSTAEGIGARFPEQRVPAQTAHKEVTPGPPDEQVIPCEAVERVVAAEAADYVGTCGPRERVNSGVADDLIS